ncbi:MAG: RHS repeat-associated core domain-containing protein [Capsulimonadaceae bacterium]|nr:RHS repeat-associated core domain-containing protein [Capsulimonadaceae bacterium]
MAILATAFGFELLAGPNGIAPPVQAMGGEPMMGTAGRVVNNLRFGGQYGYYRDGANRLYVRARVYRADWGRWLSVDPIGFEGRDWNLYRYVGNNPVTWQDPSGNVPCNSVEQEECVKLYAPYGVTWVGCDAKVTVTNLGWGLKIRRTPICFPIRNPGRQKPGTPRQKCMPKGPSPELADCLRDCMVDSANSGFDPHNSIDVFLAGLCFVKCHVLYG